MWQARGGIDAGLPDSAKQPASPSGKPDGVERCVLQQGRQPQDGLILAGKNILRKLGTGGLTYVPMCIVYMRIVFSSTRLGEKSTMAFPGRRA